MNRRILNKLGLLVWPLGLTKEALACAVCFGDPNSKMSHGIIAAMYFLLGVVISVLTGIAWTAFRWAKRTKNI